MDPLKNPKDMFFLHMFQTLGNVIGLLSFLVPGLQFIRIIMRRSTEGVSIIPHIVMLLDCTVAVWYDTPRISPTSYLKPYMNKIGIGIQTIYVLIYLIFSRTIYDKLKVFGVIILYVAIFYVIGLVPHFAAGDAYRSQFLVGVATTLSTIITYVSPVLSLIRAINTKDVQYMTFSMLLSFLLYATCWLACGIMVHDEFVIIPNALGWAIAMTQLIVYFYCKKKKNNKCITIEMLEIEVRQQERPMLIGPHCSETFQEDASITVQVQEEEEKSESFNESLNDEPKKQPNDQK